MIIGILISILCGISITRFIYHLFNKIAFVQDIYISIYNYNMAVAIKDNGELLEFNSDVSPFDYILKNQSSLRRMIIDDYNFRMISEDFIIKYRKAIHCRIHIPDKNNTDRGSINKNNIFSNCTDLRNFNLFTTEQINQIIIEDKICIHEKQQIKDKGNNVSLWPLPKDSPLTDQESTIYIQHEYGGNARSNEKRERMSDDVLMEALSEVTNYRYTKDYNPNLQSKKRHNKKKTKGENK